MMAEETLSKRSTFLKEALQETVAILDEIDERYREVALPIILQSLIEVDAADKRGSFQQDQKLHDNPSEPQTKLPANLSVNEFFQKTAPNTHIGRFVCVAYYSFHTGKAAQITHADFLEAYGKLRIKKPQNPADVLSDCVKKVYLIDAPTPVNGQKAWVITLAGEKFVEGLLNGDTNGKK